MDGVPDTERTRLIRQIEEAQAEAEMHYRRRQLLADCVALILLGCLGEKAAAVSEMAAWRGRNEAALGDWLRAALGVDHRMEPPLLDCATDILSALDRMTRKEGRE